MSRKSLRNTVGIASLTALAMTMVACGGSSTSTPAAPVNQAPKIVSINSQSGVVSKMVTKHVYGWTITGTDPEGDAITYTSATAGVVITGNNMVYTPAAAAAVGGKITVVANATGGSGTMDVTLPVIVADSEPTLGGLTLGSVIQGQKVQASLPTVDADGDMITYTTATANATIVGNVVTYAPPVATAPGDVTIALVATTKTSDGLAIATTNLNIVATVLPVPNTAPFFVSVPVDGGSVKVGKTYNYTPVVKDLENDKITFSGTGVDAATGAISYTPTVEEIGTTKKFEIVATDGKLSATQIVNIAVAAHDAPTFTTTLGYSTIVLNHGTIEYTPVATDVDGIVPTITYTGTLGTFVGGKLAYTPVAADAGKDLVFSFKADDLKGGVTTQTFTVKVTLDASPVVSVTPSPLTMVTGHTYSWTVTATDAENDAITFSCANADIKISGNALTYKPAAVGAASSFDLVATDAKGRVTTTKVTLPAVTADVVPVDQTVAILKVGTTDFTLPVSDADGDTYTYTLATGGTFTEATPLNKNVISVPVANLIAIDGKTIKVDVVQTSNGQTIGATTTVTLTLRIPTTNTAPNFVGNNPLEGKWLNQGRPCTPRLIGTLTATDDELDKVKYYIQSVLDYPDGKENSTTPGTFTATLKTQDDKIVEGTTAFMPLQIAGVGVTPDFDTLTIPRVPSNTRLEIYWTAPAGVGTYPDFNKEITVGVIDERKKADVNGETFRVGVVPNTVPTIPIAYSTTSLGHLAGTTSNTVDYTSENVVNATTGVQTTAATVTATMLEGKESRITFRHTGNGDGQDLGDYADGSEGDYDLTATLVPTLQDSKNKIYYPLPEGLKLSNDNGKTTVDATGVLKLTDLQDLTVSWTPNHIQGRKFHRFTVKVKDGSLCPSTDEQFATIEFTIGVNGFIYASEGLGKVLDGGNRVLDQGFDFNCRGVHGDYVHSTNTFPVIRYQAVGYPGNAPGLTPFLPGYDSRHVQVLGYDTYNGTGGTQTATSGGLGDIPRALAYTGNTKAGYFSLFNYLPDMSANLLLQAVTLSARPVFYRGIYTTIANEGCDSTDFGGFKVDTERNFDCYPTTWCAGQGLSARNFWLINTDFNTFTPGMTPVSPSPSANTPPTSKWYRTTATPVSLEPSFDIASWGGRDKTPNGDGLDFYLGSYLQGRNHDTSLTHDTSSTNATAATSSLPTSFRFGLKNLMSYQNDLDNLVVHVPNLQESLWYGGELTGKTTTISGGLQTIIPGAVNTYTMLDTYLSDDAFPRAFGTVHGPQYGDQFPKQNDTTTSNTTLMLPVYGNGLSNFGLYNGGSALPYATPRVKTNMSALGQVPNAPRQSIWNPTWTAVVNNVIEQDGGVYRDHGHIWSKTGTNLNYINSGNKNYTNDVALSNVDKAYLAHNRKYTLGKFDYSTAIQAVAFPATSLTNGARVDITGNPDGYSQDRYDMAPPIAPMPVNMNINRSAYDSYKSSVFGEVRFISYFRDDFNVGILLDASKGYTNEVNTLFRLGGNQGLPTSIGSSFVNYDFAGEPYQLIDGVTVYLGQTVKTFFPQVNGSFGTPGTPFIPAVPSKPAGWDGAGSPYIPGTPAVAAVPGIADATTPAATTFPCFDPFTLASKAATPTYPMVTNYTYTFGVGPFVVNPHSVTNGAVAAFPAGTPAPLIVPVQYATMGSYTLGTGYTDAKVPGILPIMQPRVAVRRACNYDSVNGTSDRSLITFTNQNVIGNSAFQNVDIFPPYSRVTTASTVTTEGNSSNNIDLGFGSSEAGFTINWLYDKDASVSNTIDAPQSKQSGVIIELCPVVPTEIHIGGQVDVDGNRSYEETYLPETVVGHANAIVKPAKYTFVVGHGVNAIEVPQGLVVAGEYIVRITNVSTFHADGTLIDFNVTPNLKGLPYHWAQTLGAIHVKSNVTSQPQ